MIVAVAWQEEEVDWANAAINPADGRVDAIATISVRAAKKRGGISALDKLLLPIIRCNR